MAAIAADGRRDMVAVLRFGEKDHTSAAPGAADLGCQRTLAQCDRDELFDHRGADPWGVSLAQLPFFTDQLGHLFPVGHGKRMMHGAGNLADPLKVVEDFFVAVDVRLEYFPIVY